MKKLTVPSYGFKLVKELKHYALTTKAKDPWGHGKQATKDFKKEVTRLMLMEQEKRCAYCGSRLFEKRPHRDHIAPKESYKEWMFWPTNLVLSCYTCNTDLKKTFDPVLVRRRSYRRSEFSFVHPFFDDPKDHITYTSEDVKVLIKECNGSLKGKKTIEVFELYTTERAKQRAKDYIHDDDASQLYGHHLSLLEKAREAIETRILKMKF